MIRAGAHEGGTGRQTRGWPPTSTYISLRIGPHRESNGPLLPRRTAAVRESPTPRIRRRHHGEPTPTIRTVVGVSSGAPLPSASPRLRERTPAWQVAHHRCAILLDSPLNESATAVGGRPVHGSRGNAENALVPTRRSFGRDPEIERDEDRKYDVSVRLPCASRTTDGREDRKRQVLSRASLFPRAKSRVVESVSF